jgi:2-oxoisovalerate dehydrogenase E1 component
LTESDIVKIEDRVREDVLEDFERAQLEPDPDKEELTQHIFAPTPITEEQGIREPEGREKVVMVDAALHAVEEILSRNTMIHYYMDKM